MTRLDIVTACVHCYNVSCVALFLELLSLMRVYIVGLEFSCLQENARITQARTNALVILDTVGIIALLTLMNVNLHHADMVRKILLPLLTEASGQCRIKTNKEGQF